MQNKAIRTNLIVTLLIIFACAVFSVFVILPQSKTLTHADADNVDAELSAPTATYIIGDDSIIGAAGALPVNDDSESGYYTYVSATNTYTYSNIEYGWIAAINARSSADSRVKVVLASDWTAERIDAKTVSDGWTVITSEFGTDDTAFYYGALYIPADKYIQLDLNGKIIDRNSDVNGKQTFAAVIYGEAGCLEIIDSDPTSDHGGLFDYERTVTNDSGEHDTVAVTGGVITGAKLQQDTSGIASGVYMTDGGRLVISAGTVIGNGIDTEVSGPVGNVGGGVYVGNLASFTMTGGAILRNSVAGRAARAMGGGVYVYSNSSFDMRGGIIADNETDCHGGGVYVNGTFTMSGGEISGNSTYYYGGGVTVDGTFIMNGGEISGNIAREHGGGVRVFGTFTMNGGEISGNSATQYGGGVYNSGTLIIEGGKISGNSSDDAGGGISNDGLLELSDGEISSNNARVGGGIYNNGTLIIEGGKISGNSAYNAGGVYNINYNSNTCTVSGGEISDNSATSIGGGLYGVSLNMFGSPVIENNKLSDGTDSDVDISMNMTMHLIGALENGARIGIRSSTNRVVTYGYATTNNSDDPTDFFFADSSEYGFGLSSAGEVLFIKNVDFTFKASYGVEADFQDVGGLVFYDEYKAGFTANYEITNNGSAAITLKNVLKDGSIFDGDAITQAGVYQIVYNVDGVSDEAVFILEIAPKILTSDDIDIVLTDEDVEFDLDGDTLVYTYDGEAKTPTIDGDFEYDGEAITYDISYENNKLAGTAYAVVTLTGNYSGEFVIPFIIDIDGGYYQVEWQYYNGSDWAELDGVSAFDYILGIYGDQSNRIRAQLTLSGEHVEDHVVKYAYAKDVSDHLDASLGSDEISGYYIEYALDGVASAFRNAGEYLLSIYNDGTETVKFNNSDDKLVNAQTLTINRFSIDPDDEKLTAMVLGECVFDGTAQQPTLSVVYDYLELVATVDYNVEYYDADYESGALVGGIAHAKVVFIGNYTGELVLDFEIKSVDNEWLSAPNIIRWSYGAFDAQSSVIIAAPRYILDDEMLGVSILDSNGGELTVDGISLSDIQVKRVNSVDYGWCYIISDTDVIAALNKLGVARYVLSVWLDGTSSYSELAAQEITFNIFKSNNYWDETPSIASWTVGRFGEDNLPIASAHFGNDGLRFVIVDVDDANRVYYDSANGINLLSTLPAGVYYLTATVAGNNNYTALTHNMMFRVLERAGDTVINDGLPWWLTLVVVFAVVLVLAIILFILNRVGVLQIMSEKMIVSMRAKADTDAIIAAVRAGKVTAATQAATPVGEATITEKEEKKVIRKAQNLEKKAKTPEEKAAELEAKAKAMRKRADAMKAKAKEMVMTPEEKKAMRDAEKAAAQERSRTKSPEERAQMLERKAVLTEEQAAQLKARAEVLKIRASDMRERAAQRANKDKTKKTENAVAENNATSTETTDGEE